MKIKLTLNKISINLLTVLITFTLSSNLVAQDKKLNELKNFIVVVENTENGLKMQSSEGSAWIDLAFNLNPYKPQAIDEYGMTKLGNTSPDKDKNLADFLFTIIKTEKGIILKGIEGTAWTDLSFYLNKNGEKAKIDQFGMTKLN